MKFPVAMAHLAWRQASCCLLAALLFCASLAQADQDYKRVAPKTRVVQSVNDQSRVTLTGNHHPLATAANDLGAAADGLRLERMILALQPDATQAAALEIFLAQTRDRTSPQFGQFLSPAEFAQHFGVAAADIAKTSQWLTDHGFSIDEVPQGGRSIDFSGTVAQVRAAFGTQIHRYRHQGKEHLANASDPSIPAALSGVVAGVVSLHDFHSQPQNIHAQTAPLDTRGGTHYLAAGDFHIIYDVNPLLAAGIDGTGRSIAILGRSNIVPLDISTFRSSMGLSVNPPQIIVNGSDPGLVSGDQGESDLDLEWSGAVAPNATIKFITSASTSSSDGIDLSAQYAVTNNVADIISLSYGQCEASLGASGYSFYSNLWQQAAAEGITVLVSAGDSGAAGCLAANASSGTGGLGVNGLCVSPYSTCVGGTEFSEGSGTYWASSNGSYSTSALSYIPEVVWNESGSNGGSGLWSSGGGKSGSYSCGHHLTSICSANPVAKPSWQTTPGVPADGVRDVPDVSLNAANHDGYLVNSSDNGGAAQAQWIYSGTSAAAPAFAGIMALVDQKTGYRQGNANPTLYGLATRQLTVSGAPAYFHRITAGNNSVPGLTGYAASTSTPAYNLATGLGSVDANVLVNHWTDLLPASSTAVSATPNPSLSGQSVSLSATVTGASPTGTVQFSDNGSHLGSAIALSGGVATLSSSALSVGSHSITAAYSGDSANQASASAALNQVVRAAASVAVTASPGSIAAAGSIQLTATVSGTSPTGTVQFQDGGANLGPTIALSGTTAVLISNALVTAGNHGLTAVYSGDANNIAATSPALMLVVSQAASTTGLSATASSVTTGQNVVFTASVNGVGPTGSVQFSDAGVNLGTAVALSSGTAVLATTGLSVGNHSISASYSGDTNNQASQSAVTAVTVSASDADVPTLPQWAELLLGSMLLLRIIYRKR